MINEIEQEEIVTGTWEPSELASLFCEELEAFPPIGVVSVPNTFSKTCSHTLRHCINSLATKRSYFHNKLVNWRSKMWNRKIGLPFSSYLVSPFEDEVKRRCGEQKRVSKTISLLRLIGVVITIEVREACCSKAVSSVVSSQSPSISTSASITVSLSISHDGYWSSSSSQIRSSSSKSSYSSINITLYEVEDFDVSIVALDLPPNFVLQFCQLFIVTELMGYYSHHSTIFSSQGAHVTHAHFSILEFKSDIVRYPFL
ncbi:hypothetical protein GQX74_013932 [Glossina fuscipes]|nr:hypothetical protein GQX74_013932 [Glossina fuscipes]